MEENKNEILISVPLGLFQMLVSRSEQIAVIERLTKENEYINVSDLRAIIAAEPLPEKNGARELSFAEMLEIKSTEESECT